MTNSDQQTYSIAEAATKLNLSEKTLRRWEEAGRFTPSRTDGNQRRYSLEDLQILDAIKHNVLPAQRDLLTAEAAAALLGVTPPTLARYVAEGSLHPFITVNHTYYPRHRLLPLLGINNSALPTQGGSVPNHMVVGLHDSPDTSDLHVLPVTPVSPTLPPVSPAPLPTSPSTPPSPVSRGLPGSPGLLIINLVFTLALLSAYHFFFNTPPAAPVTPAGSVQGAATNPSLKLLDDMLDPTTGGLTATTVISKLGTTTPNLSLLPGVAPTSPLPGSLYYDAGDNTLKVYTLTGWNTLTTSSQLQKLQFDLETQLASPSTL